MSKRKEKVVAALIKGCRATVKGKGPKAKVTCNAADILTALGADDIDPNEPDVADGVDIVVDGKQVAAE